MGFYGILGCWLREVPGSGSTHAKAALLARHYCLGAALHFSDRPTVEIGTADRERPTGHWVSEAVAEEHRRRMKRLYLSLQSMILMRASIFGTNCIHYELDVAFVISAVKYGHP